MQHFLKDSSYESVGANDGGQRRVHETAAFAALAGFDCPKGCKTGVFV